MSTHATMPAKVVRFRQPLAAADVLPLAAFENRKQFASASSLNDLAQSARTWLKRTTGRDFIVTLEAADQE